MSFCNINSKKGIDDDDDFIIDDSLSSDYYHDEFRTNSSSSIKWSTDARKQNEEDWLSIEEILYGEKELPEDDKTREEFSYWMKAFPHLRVVGKKIENLPQRNNSSIEYVEEVIAIDPPLPLRFEGESFKLLDQELNEKLSIRKQRQLSAKGYSINNAKAENLEKLLRITSSGITRNQNQTQNFRPTISNKKIVDRTSTYEIKHNNYVPTNYHHINKLSQIKERDFADSEKLSYSASSSSRMGNLLNVKFLYKKPEFLDSIQSVKSATSKLPLYELVSLDKSDNNMSKSASIHKKNLNIIQLPPFNYDLDFPIIQGRGIQSAFGKNANIRTFKH
ncbi:unnamed protein product [Chironomus riparius]|uniref:Uncharacterized protein n=1 Tax=Chironomus riparius TaxID=315576 RepID=A0A9N9S4S9_9DIPT|nr:unnamed protein product [Chironomus riparius]